jgi:hypothetical protein
MYLEATGSDGAAFGLFFIGEHAQSTRESRADVLSAGQWSSVRFGLLASRLALYLGVSSTLLYSLYSV